jgi:hypothetical protein
MDPLPMTLRERMEERDRRRTELRDLLMADGFDLPDGAALNGVLCRCRDVDLAFAALTMIPRPPWVQAIAGPLRPGTLGR